MSSEMFWLMLLAAGVLLAVSAGVGYRRMKIANRIMTVASDRAKANYPDLGILGPVAYQGGLPQFPKPSVLLLALNKEKLVLFNEHDFLTDISVSDWLKVERFVLRQKTDNRGRSSVMLGPFGSLFFKDKFRLFITIRYIDIDREENNILFELQDRTIQQEIYDQFLERYSQIQKMEQVS